VLAPEGSVTRTCARDTNAEHKSLVATSKGAPVGDVESGTEANSDGFDAADGTVRMIHSIQVLRQRLADGIREG
jgi:hypothetical protein